jgi:hypothetical protein
VTVHVPAPVIVIVVPEMAQLSIAPTVKFTGRPEDAVADTVNGGSP